MLNSEAGQRSWILAVALLGVANLGGLFSLAMGVVSVADG